jgi:hypothetical protein
MVTCMAMAYVINGDMAIEIPGSPADVALMLAQLCDCDPDGPEYHCNRCGLRYPDHAPDCRWLVSDHEFRMRPWHDRMAMLYELERAKRKPQH